MPVEDLDIFCYYDVQRFTQFGSMDCANWYAITAKAGKRQQALYPAMGRRHVEVFNQNKLIFNSEPRFLFKSIDFVYVVVGSQVIQIDDQYNQKVLTNTDFNKTTGNVFFSWLAVNTQVFCLLSAPSGTGRKLFLITEDGASSTMVTVTDGNAPSVPLYVAAFGNRFVASEEDSPQFFLSVVGVPVVSTMFSPGVGSTAVFASASGKIGQFGVLHNQLYIFTDFQTDVWANIPSQIFGVSFPWKINSSYNFDVGISDPFSLDIDFGRMVWLARNRNGLVDFVVSTGQQPQTISTQAIDVLLQKSSTGDNLSPFLESTSNGFLYQYESSIFYRVVAGDHLDFGDTDLINSTNSLEYNFDIGEWHRCIELNGERNRIQQHTFFNNKHLVTILDDPSIYEMAGDIYYNETINSAQSDRQASNAFLKFPMRYELVTKQYYLPDYAMFITKWLQIDFVFGNETFNSCNSPFDNTVYIVDEASTDESPIYVVSEDSDPDDPTFVIQEGTNTPTFSDNHYNALFKPHIQLWFSDDGGVSYRNHEVLEFSQLGVYQWRMRWYELGTSRNRTYKLVCVSSAPIVILGAVHMITRASGGQS